MKRHNDSKIVLRSPDKYAHARIAIIDVFHSNHRCYGYRRMRAALGRRQTTLYRDFNATLRIDNFPPQQEKCK